jgi:tetratricopeptide (TPR) repeat protein
VSEPRRKRRDARAAAKPRQGEDSSSRSEAAKRVRDAVPPAPPSQLALGVAALALVLATVLVYFPVHRYPFIGFDDPGYVTENPRVKAGLTFKSLAWAMTSNYFANWHPLTWISHMVDVQVFGLNAGAHHTVNLVLHVVNTLLLFVVLWRMSGAPWRSLAVAALFAVHPMHVESVAWIAERKDVLSTLLWLLTMWAYLAYTKDPRVRRYVLVLVLFALGLMAKPMVVTLPCVLLLLDVWPLKRAIIGESRRGVWLRLIYEKVPLFALAAASSVVTYLAQRTSGAVESLSKLPLSVRAANALLSYWNYIAKLVWPQDLGLLYPYPKTLWVGAVLGALVVIIAISILVGRLARTRPYLLVGWLWFVGTLVPVIGIVQVGKQPMADRYTYVPSIGLFVLAVWGAWDLLERLRMPRSIAWALPLAATAAYAIVARRQVDFWRSGVVLWEHTIAVTGANYLAENNLGWDLARENKPAEAIPHYLASIRESPRFAGSRTNLALALVAVGHYAEAIEQYEEALRLLPDSYLIHGNLAFALTHVDRLDDAVSHFKQAIKTKSDYVEALNGLGLTLARKGDVAGAIREYNEALGYFPKFPEAHNNLGAALASQGKLDEGISHFAEAVRLKPDFPDAHNNYGVALSTQGKLDEAVAQFLEAVRQDPNHAKAHYGLGLALERQGRVAEAAREFSEVLRIRPGDADAQRALNDLRQRGQ